MASARPAALLASVALALLPGCGATPRPDLKSAPPPSASATAPADGITLAQLGFRNGPAGAFSVPRTVVWTTSVDEPSGVTVVFSRPDAAVLADYLRRVLPGSGFVVTGDARATATLTFTGYGWHGSFTGAGASSALILRP